MEKELNLAAAILTKNNEETIEKTLGSVRELIRECIIVDDGSTDRTLSIVQSMIPNAKIFHRKLDDFSSQRNFSLEKCISDWVLIIDSDEFLSEELAQSIVLAVQQPRSLLYSCKRLNRNMVGWGESRLDRPILMRKHLRFVDPIHETVLGQREMLSGHLYHDCWKDIDSWADDIKRYASWRAKHWLEKYPKRSLFLLTLRQIVAANYVFIKRFFWEKRFKQGVIGFIYCLAWSFEEFLVLLKFVELRKDVIHKK